MKSRTVIVLFVTCIILALLIFLSSFTVKPHECKYLLCPFKGEKVFKHGCGFCKPNTDCWKLDKIHFDNPTIDYDSCEKIFIQQKYFKTD